MEMKINYNINKYKVLEENVLDVDGNVIHENDYCEYTNGKGEIRRARVKCVEDHDCHHTEFAFIYKKGGYKKEDGTTGTTKKATGNNFITVTSYEHSSYWDRVEDCTNIKVIKNEDADVEVINVVTCDGKPACAFYPVTRLKVIDILKPKLLNCGFTVEEHSQGFLVNNKYIVASGKRKWRVKGRNKWYWYKDVESLKKYFD